MFFRIPAQTVSVDVEAIVREFAVVSDGNAALIGFDTPDRHARLAEALALGACSFRAGAGRLAGFAGLAGLAAVRWTGYWKVLSAIPTRSPQ
jgi:hypothetical protein